MFTGMIEEQGVVASLNFSSQNAKLTIASKKVFTDTKVGDSIAINGICLTVSNLHRGLMDFDVSPETLKRSNLRDLKTGEKVNLERALLLSSRLGGHMVAGHVDGVGEIRQINRQEKGFEMALSIPSDLLRYLVPKGSIAVDGISLTVADLRDGLMVVAVVPHTAANTTLSNKKISDKVNIEVDLLSKYIERHLAIGAEPLPVEDPMIKVGFLPMGWTDN